MAVSQNNGQHVVEVVSNAACQIPDGFHFLSLAKLLLQFLALAHITGDAVSPYRSSFLVEYKACADFKLYGAAIPRDNLQLVSGTVLPVGFFVKHALNKILIFLSEDLADARAQGFTSFMPDDLFACRI